jgi:F-type H+-transporting ATPase subunit delta
MPNPRLAGRYAKSLIDIAVERGILEDVNKDIEYLQAVIDSSKEFCTVLSSPVIKEEKKLAILKAVTKGKITSTTEAFFDLLMKKNRENVLTEITIGFREQYNVIKGINKVKLVTAQPISEDVKAAILNKLTVDAGLTNIEMETKVDESLIGGFILEYNNNIVNASVLHDLLQIKKSFLRNDYIFNIR